MTHPNEAPERLAEIHVECPSCQSIRIVWPHEAEAYCDSCGRDVLDVEPASPVPSYNEECEEDHNTCTTTITRTTDQEAS
jgi:hypothetical protein